MSIVISAQRASPRNQWSGLWEARWTVTPGSGSATIDGSMRVFTQYSEVGNAQFNTAYSPATVTVPFTVRHVTSPPPRLP